MYKFVQQIRSSLPPMQELKEEYEIDIPGKMGGIICYSSTEVA